MIPKPLNEIEWSDIEALRDSGREEDDTIEYKASFSGGSDYLEFNDAKRAKAVEGVAREVVAFLNARGGDVVIGVREAANDHPKIEEITLVDNIDQTVDRLGQSLAALIEPTQSVLALRAVRRSDGDKSGVIVIRCPLSLRAPHRFSPNRECYVRRGRASVPMPMDEIQDVTLTRSMRRSERLASLTEKFFGLTDDSVRRTQLPTERFRLKIVYAPLVNGEINMDDKILGAFRHSKPTVVLDGKVFEHSSVLDNLDHSGRPMLRGRIYEGVWDRGVRQVYCAALINSGLEMEWDYVDSGRYTESSTDPKIGMFDGWIIGCFARVIFSLHRVFALHGSFAQGILRAEMFVKGDQKIIVGDRLWQETSDLPIGHTRVPDFELNQASDLVPVFEQLQKDFYAIAGLENQSVFSINGLQ